MLTTGAAPPYLVEVDGHPEFMEAMRIIARAGHPVGKVYRVFSAGDPQALRDEDGVACETVLYVPSKTGKPMTALLRTASVVQVSEGWPA